MVTHAAAQARRVSCSRRVRLDDIVAGGGNGCTCEGPHRPRRRIVITGGPGAGKTAVLELARQILCRHVAILPEAAGIVFGGGFPREASEAGARAAQRAIFHVQRELETLADVGSPAIVLCDRGTVDGTVYWRGAGDLCSNVGTTLQSELARYDLVMHLRSPGRTRGYNHVNPLRIESAEMAREIDARILDAWASHPRRIVVDAHRKFIDKAEHVLDAIRAELPPCCAARPFDGSAREVYGPAGEE
jgi:thymidylate kinase